MRFRSWLGVSLEIASVLPALQVTPPIADATNLGAVRNVRRLAQEAEHAGARLQLHAADSGRRRNVGGEGAERAASASSAWLLPAQCIRLTPNGTLPCTSTDGIGSATTVRSSRPCRLSARVRLDLLLRTKSCPTLEYDFRNAVDHLDRGLVVDCVSGTANPLCPMFRHGQRVVRHVRVVEVREDREVHEAEGHVVAGYGRLRRNETLADARRHNHAAGAQTHRNRSFGAVVAPLVVVGVGSLDLLLVDDRSQRIVAEVLLPQPWREFDHAAGRMLANPLQHIDEVGVGIDIVQPAGLQQTLDDAHMLGAQLGPAEQIVLAVM